MLDDARISTLEYEALREALPAVVWYKRSFERYLRTSLRNDQDLLDGLDWTLPERDIADAVVDRMVAEEDRYHEAAPQLMLEVASMDNFPDPESLDDAERLVAKARQRVAELQRHRQHL